MPASSNPYARTIPLKATDFRDVPVAGERESGCSAGTTSAR